MGCGIYSGIFFNRQKGGKIMSEMLLGRGQPQLGGYGMVGEEISLAEVDKTNR